MKRCIASVLVLMIFFTTQGQALKKVGYTELANAIFLSGPKDVNYKNVHFINDLPNKGAEVFFTTYIEPDTLWTIYGGFKNYLQLKGAKKDSLGLYYSTCQSITIENCRFDNDLRFSNVNFYGSLILVNNDFPNQSEDYVGSFGQAFGGAVLIDSCRFRKDLMLIFRKELPYRFFFKFNNSEVNGLKFELQKSTTQISKSVINRAHLQIHGDSEIDLDGNSIGPSYFELGKINWVRMSDCTIADSSEDFSIFYWRAESIELWRNTFNANVELSFEESRLSLDGNKFEKQLALDFNSIERSSYVNLKSLNNLDIGLLFRGKYYDATTREQINDDIGYRKYLRMNKALYDHFREVGDMKSSNETYVRIREIENVKLGMLYDSLPTFQNFFSLNLNRLLKHYTNYGTDPAKALVVSFYIILIFGIFYFFFPSDWDVTSKSKLIQNFRDFIEKNEKGYFKPFLVLMLGILVSSINATTLSLNAFTTLGFGNIPTHGVARYVCVAEGFIGWFLLSIFTVALINQAQF